MKLIIIESPNKITKIRKYAGADYNVVATVGHVRGFLNKGDFNQGVDVENNFKPLLGQVKERSKTINDIKALVKKATTVYLAGDPDRAGQRINADIAYLCGLDIDTTKCLVFHEITKKSIDNALRNPTTVDKNLYYADLGRSVLDRLIGYQISPVLWAHVQHKLSAGRCQSVATRLIVEKEKEIEEFEPESYYAVSGRFKHKVGTEIAADLNTTIEARDDVVAFLNDCKTHEFLINGLKKTIRTQKPSPPFITSSLQQTASSIGFSPKGTMSSCQKLFENSHITYPRTDSTNIPDDNMQAIQEYVLANYGEEYYNRTVYKSKVKNAQEGHCAIIVTDVTKPNVDDDVNMNTYDRKLYRLIWKRTVASQMMPAKFNVITLNTNAVKDTGMFFIAKSEKVLFDGFLKVYNIESTVSDDAENVESDDEKKKNVYEQFAKMKVGNLLFYEEITAKNKYTNAGARYTEASLVKKLESIGCGRPSTFATIINTIQVRGYVVKDTRTFDGKPTESISLEKGKDDLVVAKKEAGKVTEKNKMFPTDIGISVTNFLMEKFAMIMDYKFTSKIEDMLDDISNGKREWQSVVKTMYDVFNPTVVQLLKDKPKCVVNMDADEEGQEDTKFMRRLGKNAEGEPVYARVGKKNNFVQLGNVSGNIRYASFKKGQRFDKITLDDALKLLEYPKTLGDHEGRNIAVNIGEYGVYLKWGERTFSVKDVADPGEVTLDIAKRVIANYGKDNEGGETKGGNSKVLREINKTTKIINGKYGICILYDKKFYKMPTDSDYEKITLKEIKEIAAKPKTYRG